MTKTSGTIYRLRVRLMGDEELNRIWRVIEISSMATLTALHQTIFQAFDREDDDHLWSFYFGKLGRPQMMEYARVLVNDEEEDGLVPPTRLARGVKLASLPFVTEKQIHYLFDYGDKWWHKIEFVGEFPAEAGVKYPRIVKRQGESPPQYEDFEEPDDASFTQKPSLHRQISFEDLDALLRTRPKALSTPEVIGYLRGTVSAANIVMPSRYFGLLLGSEPFESKEQLADLHSLLFSLHNHLADSISSGIPLVLRRSSYPVTRDGLLLLVSDLRMEMQGYRRGLDLGCSDPEDLDKDGIRALMAMVEADALLEGVEDFQKRTTSLKPAEIKQTHKQLMGMAETIDTIMMDLAVAFRSTRKQNIESMVSHAFKTDVGRNDPCPCGSGKKYKACCLKKVH